MNVRHYLTAILIFSVIFLSVFSVHAQNQNSSDEIRIVSSGIGYAFYQNNKKLSMGQLANVTQENAEAHRYIIKAVNRDFASVVFGVAGGGCVGFSLGYALGAAIRGNPLNMKMFLPVLNLPS